MLTLFQNSVEQFHFNSCISENIKKDGAAVKHRPELHKPSPLSKRKSNILTFLLYHDFPKMSIKKLAKIRGVFYVNAFFSNSN